MVMEAHASVVIRKFNFSTETRYTLAGALFGLLFPLGSLLSIALTGELPMRNGLMGWIREVHGAHRLIWIIDSAPLFLGFFARLAGLREARLRALNAQLGQQIEEKTLHLQAALKEAERANECMCHIAEHDVLTGIFNRRRFQSEVERCLAQAKRYDRSVALLFIDLDAFKPINDVHGHEVGDAYLLSFVDLLQRTFRATDLIARWGGDEFLVLLPESDATVSVGAVQRFVESMKATVFEIGNSRFTPQASLGLAMFPGDASDADGLVVAADQAMYRVKKAGGNGFQMAGEVSLRESFRPQISFTACSAD